MKKSTFGMMLFLVGSVASLVIALVGIVQGLFWDQYALCLSIFIVLGVAGFIICLREAYLKK